MDNNIETETMINEKLVLIQKQHEKKSIDKSTKSIQYQKENFTCL